MKLLKKLEGLKRIYHGKIIVEGVSILANKIKW